MSNVTWAERQIKVYEVAVPNPATRRDIAELLNSADRRLAEVDPVAAGRLHDDAYMVEARDGQIVAVIKVEKS